MRTSHWLPALVLGLGVLIAAPAADAPKADAERIAQLIKQLGSESFEEREKATKDLETIGVPALDALRRAAKDGEAEVKTRADALVQKLEKQNSTAKLLAPTKVKLSFKETPLADAIAEFNKKSGYTIQLNDPADKKLKDRTITLDTGEVTFWEAFDKFCAKAGLVEATLQDMMKGFPGGGPGNPLTPGGLPATTPLPPPPPNPARPAPPPDKKGEPKEEKKKDDPKPAAAAAPVAARAAVVAQIQIGGGGAAPPGGFGGGGGPVPAGGGFGLGGGAFAMPFPGLGASPGVIAVLDGKPKTVPTCYSGAVRIRALKESPNVGFALPFPGPGAAPKDDGYVVWLEVRAEPKIQILSLQSAALEKATDDQDQQLTQVVPAAPPLPPGGVAPGGAVLIRPGVRLGGMLASGMGGFGGTYSFPVYLKKGDKEAKALKAFAGSINAMVLTPAETIITADKITKAAGETFKGKESGQIKINEVKEEDGKLTLKFEVEQPRDIVPPNTTGPVGPVAIPPRIRRGIPVPPPAPAPAPAPPGGGAGVAFQAPPAPPVAPPPIKIQIQIGGAGGGQAVALGGFAAPGISLVDDKGKAIPQTGGAPPKFQFTPGGTPKMEYTQEYKLAKDQKPAKLILSGSKMANLDIPFKFKDVLLK